jgi:Type II secretion system (T2SS), protein E, N-terminal domain
MSTPLRERPDAPLGTLIFRAGLLPAETIESALEEGVKTGKRLGEILTERGLLKEADLARLLAGQKGLEFVTLREQIVDFSAAALFSEDQARLFRALPYAWEDGAPVIAIADPSDDVLTRNVREALGREDAKFVVSVRSELSDIIGETYARSAAAAPAPSGLEPAAAPNTFEGPTSERAPVSPAPSVPVEPPAPEPAVEPSLPEPVAPAAAAAPPVPEAAPVVLTPEPAAEVPEEPPVEHAMNGHSGNRVAPAEVVLVPQPEPHVEPVGSVEPTPVAATESEPPAPPAPEQPVVAPELRVPTPEPVASEPVVVEPVAVEPVVVEPVVVEPVVVEPVVVEPPPEPAVVEPAPEPAVHAPVAEEPAVAHAPVAVEPEASAHAEPETHAAPAPEPAAEEPAPQALEPEAETQPEPAEETSFAVSIRLTNGERVEVGAYGDIEAAKASAKGLMAQVAAADGGDWPFVSGRFLKPDTIVSVDIS